MADCGYSFVMMRKLAGKGNMQYQRVSLDCRGPDGAAADLGACSFGTAARSGWPELWLCLAALRFALSCAGRIGAKLRTVRTC